MELPGCKLTPSGVEFASNVTKENLRDLGIALQQVEGCRAWWWGDWVNRAREIFGKQTKTFVEKSGLRVATLWEYGQVSEFFPSATRVVVDGITHKHHRLAKYAACGDLEVARDWLRRAVDNHWTSAQMNKAIRDAKVLQQDPSIVHHHVEPADKLGDAIAANIWARHALKAAQSWDNTRVEAVLESIPELVDLIDLLRSRMENPSTQCSRNSDNHVIDIAS